MVDSDGKTRQRYPDHVTEKQAACEQVASVDAQSACDLRRCRLPWRALAAMSLQVPGMGGVI
jgi:hypothetical protein